MMKTKRLTLLLLSAFALLSLSACEVHFGSARFDVPWWTIALPVLLILLIAHILIVRKTYICPECKARFRPKWYEISSWTHLGNHRLVKCPHCGRRSFCPPEQDS